MAQFSRSIRKNRAQYRLCLGFFILLLGCLLYLLRLMFEGMFVDVALPSELQRKQQQLQNMPALQRVQMPVAGVRVHQVADTWGGARSQGRRHEGVDIFAAEGTAVLSSTVGLVEHIGVNDLGGKVVRVFGPNASRHYYAHLHDYAPHLQEGHWVEVGSVLGYVGNTGNAKNTPAHLHYGIYLDGQAVNPYPYLQAY